MVGIIPPLFLSQPTQIQQFSPTGFFHACKDSLKDAADSSSNNSGLQMMA